MHSNAQMPHRRKKDLTHFQIGERQHSAMSGERVIALLGRSEAPADAVEEYCPTKAVST